MHTLNIDKDTDWYIFGKSINNNRSKIGNAICYIEVGSRTRNTNAIGVDNMIDEAYKGDTKSIGVLSNIGNVKSAGVSNNLNIIN